jgi:hemolysin III
MIYRLFKDPFSGLTHLLGAFLGLFGLFYLVDFDLGNLNWKNKWPFVVFGVSVILMYSSSAIYHLLHVSDSTRKLLRRIDHTMIFLLIAGTYTPFCIYPLKDSYGTSILITVWSIAFFGLFVKIFWMHAPRWVSTGLYLLMGWVVVVAIYPLSQKLSFEGMFTLVFGGLLYSIGAVVYALKRPDPFPPHFGFHEIWHLFVLAGTASHFVSVSSLR